MLAPHYPLSDNDVGEICLLLVKRHEVTFIISYLLCSDPPVKLQKTLTNGIGIYRQCYDSYHTYNYVKVMYTRKNVRS